MILSKLYYFRFFFLEKYKDPRYSAGRLRIPDIRLADPLGAADPTLGTTAVWSSGIMTKECAETNVSRIKLSAVVVTVYIVTHSSVT